MEDCALLSWNGHVTSFSRRHIFERGQLAVLAVSVATFLMCLSLTLWRIQRRRKARFPSGITPLAARESTATEHQYDPKGAWLEGGAFISLCFMLSWAAGVLDATFFHPCVVVQAQSDSAAFFVFTAAAFVVVIVGYWLIWPVGTVAYGRKWGWHCVLFGVLDGLAEAQLFLCIWALIELAGLPRYGTGLVTFLMQGGFKANWDQKYWNVRVAPAHNVQDWNKWKVLFVHLPNVLVTFSYFITYGSATLYVASQTVALLGSTSAMRFPSPLSSYTNPPLASQVVSFGDKHRAELWSQDHWTEARATPSGGVEFRDSV
eukprot:TRINITY_DN2294_c0_g1_i2.p1 TRINITY_DN2294_c0_g1~~TRINITY_DN2294_c0_g1_i2.p1  ORF type:complete len:317 (+),score=39.70 TRINITY_DN2294_c0_g1_i2:80-1030(+)